MLMNWQFWYDEGVLVVSLIPTISCVQGKMTVEWSALGPIFLLHRDGSGKSMEWRYHRMILSLKWTEGMQITGELFEGFFGHAQ